MPLLIFFVSLLFFTCGLAGEEITGFDSRFYLFAKEMWEYGISWFPTTYGEPYPDYPATSTVLIYLTAKLGGGLNKLTAVLPSAIAASLMVVLTYLIGELRKKDWGILAVCFMFLTFMFIKSARALSLDMYPAIMTAGCFYLIYSADVLHKPNRVKWIFPLLFLGFAFRGPIGLVIPTGVVCVYYLLDGRIKKMLAIGIAALILLIACFALLLFLAHRVGGQAFATDVLRMQMAGRINNYYQPIYFYFVNCLTNYALSFPLAILVILAAFIRHRAMPAEATTQSLIKLIGWMLIVLIGMSIPGDKKPRYVLAMTPAIALLASYILIIPKQRYFQILNKGLSYLLLILPGLLLAGVIVTSVFAQSILKQQINILPVIFALLVSQIIALNARKHIVSVTVLAAISFAVVYIFIVEPLEIYFDQSRDFVTMLEIRREQAGAQIVFYQEGRDNLPIKYMANSKQLIKPAFINTPDELTNFSSPAFFITNKKNYLVLTNALANRFEFVAEGRIGHVAVVVFKQRK